MSTLDTAAIDEAIAAAGVGVGKATEPKAAAKPAKAPAKDTGEKMHVIRISTDQTNPFPVQVAVQGVLFLIERGKDVTVPERVVEVLRNAVELRYNRAEDGTLVPYEHPSYNFSIIG